MPNPDDGNYRYVADRRQFGGLLMITAFCALIFPLTNIAEGVGPSGPLATDAGTDRFWQFVGNCCLFAIGVCSMLVGYMEFICDWGELTHSTLLIVLTQSAFIIYVADMSAVGLTMMKDPPQFFVAFPGDPLGIINERKLDETEEVKFIGSVGILGVLVYGFSFIGSIAFMQFSIYAFRKGRPQDRNGDYFRGRMGLYSMMTAIGGICQILLGSFATELNISDGRIEGGLIRVAMFIVHIPYLTIVVGCLQFLNGFWGFCRSCYVFVGGQDDHYFQYSMAFLWVVVLTCQAIVQVALLPAGLLASASTSFATISFGIIFMPAYLDYKMRNTPMYIDEEYYFGPEPTKDDESKPMIQAGRPETSKKPRPVQLRRVYVMEQPAIVYDDYYDGPDGEDAAPYLQEAAPPIRKPEKEEVKEQEKEEVKEPEEAEI